jgi:glutamine cyclotransferase
MRMRCASVVLALTVLLRAAAQPQPNVTRSYAVQLEFPHDTAAFTQGKKDGQGVLSGRLLHLANTARNRPMSRPQAFSTSASAQTAQMMQPK